MPRDGGEPDPFSVWKGSKAALRGSSEGAARERWGSTREQGGSREGAQAVKAAGYGFTRGAACYGSSARL